MQKREPAKELDLKAMLEDLDDLERRAAAMIRVACRQRRIEDSPLLREIEYEARSHLHSIQLFKSRPSLDCVYENTISGLTARRWRLIT